MDWRRLSEATEQIDMVVFTASVLTLSGFVALIMATPSTADALVDTASSLILVADGMVHHGVILFALIFVVAVVVTPWGSHRLGGPDARPEFGHVTYFAVLFSASIAASLIFWGPAEAIIHFNEVPPGSDAEAGTDEAAIVALRYTMFHSGISVWSLYIAFGVVISYYVYDRGAPLRASAVLTPFIGTNRLNGPLANAVDVIAVVAPIVGTVATVGQVSQQFLTGVEHRWAVEFTQLGVILFMLALVLVFTVSAITGIHRGIRRLSIVNLAAFVVLGVAVFILGPTNELLAGASSATQEYVREFGTMSTAGGTEWAEQWTLFHWAWWLSWVPFVGLFVARISRGRTLRSVVGVGVGATSLATVVWYLILGGSALHFELTGQTTIPQDEALAGFTLFEVLPGETLLLILFLVLIVTFLVTSADSLTLCMAFQTTEIGTDPSAALRGIWGGLQAGMTTALVLVGGTRVAEAAPVIAGTLVAPILVLAIVGVVYDVARGETPQERERTSDRESERVDR